MGAIAPTSMFHYSPLSQREIRLLQIDADKGSPSIQGLCTVSLDQTPAFYALSHCWGTNTERCPVLIGNRTLHVPPDLALGITRLCQFSASQKLEPPLQYLWTDTLCINQADREERSSQVQLMGDIYSTSVRTLIWLGKDSTLSLDGWRLLDKIYDVFRQQHPTAEVVTDIPIQLYSSRHHIATGLPGWNDESWVHFKTLLDTRWFARVWVVQEVVLSPKDPLIIQADLDVYPWQKLGWAVAWLRRCGFTRLPQISKKALNVDTMCNIRRSRVRWPLDALMSLTYKKFHASDQRDKIYGLLGLAVESQTDLPGPLVPTYDDSAAEIYQKVARFLLRRNRSLAMFTNTRGTPDSLDRLQREHDLGLLPSWVPDWSDYRESSSSGSRTSLSWVDYSSTKDTPCFGFPDHYTASSGLPAIVHTPLEAGPILSIDGLRVDEIIQAVALNQQGLAREDFNIDFISAMKLALGVSSYLTTKTNLVSWVVSLIKAMTAMQHRLSGHEWDQILKDGAGYILELLPSIPGVRYDADSAVALSRLSLSGEPERFVALAQNYCYNRSFIITSQGQMGIGPSASRERDEVVIVLGGGVPYILRPQTHGTFLFIGESYIDGLMAGGGIEERRQLMLKKEVLHLQ